MEARKPDSVYVGRLSAGGTGASQSLSISLTHYFFHDRWKNAPIPVWGYQGGVKTSGYLGPTIPAEQGIPATVAYANTVPKKHLLNVNSP